ncbi:DNA-packaging protein [Caulobacter sp. NIBR2454]|uniref:DNA-packaging protein n=1 Tax=Caulobacter sp. NIBR2454 TaxID=3015996 RepID=UPI0022B65038|nr:terminase family protein [Caulobacter sp. NIBR2454]
MIASAAGMSPSERREKLTPRETERLAEAWVTRAHDLQLEPTDAYRTWLFLGGRGAGKTRAGAEWALSKVTAGARLALVGPTLHDVREVMIEGPSGLMTISGERGVRWEASRRRLVWNGGGVAYAFSAEDPDSLRGPQFTHAWADEFCAWKKPDETLAMLRFGLRLGTAPQLMISTTPRPIPALKRLMAEPGAVTSRAPTTINADNLSPDFVADLTALYGGTRLAAQELDGLIVEDLEGALWRTEDLARARGLAPARFERVVVGLDPPVTATGDACGIVVCGLSEGRGFVLADRSVRGLSPLGWAARAAGAAREFDADLIVAEANQGGEMVRSTLEIGGADRPVKLVHASRSKRTRAEPVAALYEQGRVVHCGHFAALEEEMLALGTAAQAGSPDRADALVWALGELMLRRRGAGPRVRVL